MKRLRKEQLQIGHQRIEVSNLDKLLYPRWKFTKAKVIDYYIRISEYLLPHLRHSRFAGLRDDKNAKEVTREGTV
jgi:DNA primase